MIVDQFDEMVEQCATQPLVMTISLHPFVVGQPFRLPSLRKALKHCVEHPSATASGGRGPARSPTSAMRCRRAPFRATGRSRNLSGARRCAA